MKVLALTHAHLNLDGLSPVSCERADSIAGTWGEKFNWDVDVVYTKHTKWAGIWPGGKGLKINIVTAEAPESLMMGKPQLFSATIKTLLANNQLHRIFSLVNQRIKKRVRIALAKMGIVFPYELFVAEKWGKYLSSSSATNTKRYDFIFVCVGYGDEYLLQTGLTISQKLNVPMVVDFRDLWSDHHEPDRFTAKQRKMILRHEIRLLKNTILLSVPQKPMLKQLEKSIKIPVHHTSHSAHVEKDWEDGEVISDEFRMLYAGKLYAGSPGLNMLLELLQKLSVEKTGKPVKCHFFVDDVTGISNLTSSKGLSSYVVIHEWVSPAEIWKEMRSAHLLITFDTGISQSMPLLMTKTYQYAYSGRPILALYKHKNETYEEFFAETNSGVICYNVENAVACVKKISLDEQQYEILPTFRKIITREDTALAFGIRIQELLKKQ